MLLICVLNIRYLSIVTPKSLTLVPVISKVFEMFILNFCADNIVSDDLQFWFKKGLGCANAIFTLEQL